MSATWRAAARTRNTSACYLVVPAKARADAAHIAIAAVHGMDYLLTWNCRHIANAVTRKRIDQLLRGAGYEAPVLCTPEELLEG